jgi:hypothetical protein
MLLNYRNSGGSGLPTTGNSLGNMLYWNGSAWVKLPSGLDGQILRFKGGIPVWDNESFLCGLNFLSDIDGNKYETVQIGSQCWMKENLRVSSYNDGTLIPIVTVTSSWGLLTTGGRCWHNNDSINNEIPYGKLYNWYAAKGIVTPNGAPTKNICPPGWRIPTDQELATSLTPTTIANFFSPLPAGYRRANGNFDIRQNAIFWSITESGSNAALYTWDFSLNNVFRYVNEGKTFGTSLRCLKE